MDIGISGIRNCQRTAGFLTSIFVFDISSEEWTDLSAMIQNPSPVARMFAGFASAGDRMFLFGGNSYSGE